MILYRCEVPYEIVGINSRIPGKALTDQFVYPVGFHGCHCEHRCMIRFCTQQLSNQIHIARANLKITTRRGVPTIIKAYQITTPWNIVDVSWLNQPLYSKDHEIIQSYMDGHSTFYYDITNLVNHWIQIPESNQGLIFLSSYSRNSTYVEFAMESSEECRVSLILEYYNEYVPVKPCAYQYKENVMINGIGEYHTTAYDISLCARASYFLSNCTNTRITVNIEHSPDCNNYYKEIQMNYVAPGESLLVSPINYSKYMRLSLASDLQTSTGVIQVWLDVQESSFCKEKSN